jgi:streptogramin lyase
MTTLKFVALFLFTATAYAQPSGTFELVVGDYHGIGAQLAAVVGPGPTPGSERFYASYIYDGSTLDVLSIDPDTGFTEAFPNPAQGEYGAWGMTVGPDGNVYLGTLPHAHFFKLDTKQGTLLDLGRPSSTEQFIWDVAFGSDNRLYGVTYPNCKLVRYDPATGRLEDLGRLDPTESYARSIAASKDGFIYAGIGSSKANIAAYEIRTGQRREILPPDVQGVPFPRVYRSADGSIYGAVGKRLFHLTQWNATELESGHTVPAEARNALHDARTLSLSENQGILTLTVTNPTTHTKVEHKTAYQGHKLPLVRIGFGPDGVLYGSSALPSAFIKSDINRHSMEELGSVGSGEVYSFLGHGQRLLMGAYGGLSILMSYQPNAPFRPAGQTGNPVLVPLENGNPSWRPMAMIAGPDGSVYVGVVAGYGKLDSPLIAWNVETGSVQLNDGTVHDQSVVSLATWHDLIIGGTSITGGGGSHPTQKDAKLFIWNPKTRHKDFEIVPVSGAANITDLVTAPNDLVYGVAGNTLFEFNPATERITKTKTLPSWSLIYNSVSVDGAGRIWGLAHNGIFMIDTKTFNALLVASSPVPITGGFALKNGKVYFIFGSAVYSYTM